MSAVTGRDACRELGLQASEDLRLPVEAAEVQDPGAAAYEAAGAWSGEPELLLELLASRSSAASWAPMVSLSPSLPLSLSLSLSLLFTPSLFYVCERKCIANAFCAWQGHIACNCDVPGIVSRSWNYCSDAIRGRCCSSC